MNSVALRLCQRSCLHKSPKCLWTALHRYSSTSSDGGEKLEAPPNKGRKTMVLYEQEARKVRFYFIERYIDYLKNYDTVLERSFKGAMSIYRVFTMGTKEFLVDLKQYFKILRYLKTSKFKGLTRREIELYQQMPKDMKKAAPVLLISALPFTNYLIFPLAYLFPRHLLTSHFWTLQQKSEFATENLRDRLVYNRPLFRELQERLESDLRGHELGQKWGEVLGMMGSGVQPEVERIIECQELFKGEPYHLFYLPRRHVRYLLKIHDLHLGWFRKSRLTQLAILLKEMDKAIIREGGVHNMPLDALKKACFIRGLNPSHMRTEDMVTWLENWIKISNVVNQDNLSLLLHSPILLAYNEPSNWVLIYPKKAKQS